MRANSHSNILNGGRIAQKQFDISRKEIAHIQKHGEKISLAAVRIGDGKDAELYSQSLEKLFLKLSLTYLPVLFPKNISEGRLHREIRKLNVNPKVTAIMVFSPLPKHLQAETVLSAVDLMKDAEGRRVIHGIGDRMVSPTARAVLMLIEESAVAIAGKEAVVIGHSDVVGKPTALLLMDKMATVTVCHKKTRDLEAHIQKADIVVAAAGCPQLVKGGWIKPGAVVIDVGENVVDGKLVGDVEFEEAAKRAAFISPVPGGVGPVTNIMLVKNLIALHHLKRYRDGNR